MATKIHDLYVTALQNAHALEAQAMQAGERHAEHMDRHPELRDRLRQHREESRHQQQRIEQILTAQGSSPSKLKDIGTAITGSLSSFGQAVMHDDSVRNAIAGYTFAHFEVASYKALVELAQAAGDANGARLLGESLQEETRMADWLGEHLAPAIRRHLQAEAPAAKAKTGG